MQAIPERINTGCAQLNELWNRYALVLLQKPGLLIADTDDDLNWHAFLGHSIDLQGFRAAEFAGVDSLRKSGCFDSLTKRRIGVTELGQLWENENIKNHLIYYIKNAPMADTYQILRSEGGTIGNSLAEAFESFPWRKGHWCVRAILQNSATLKPFSYSFRNWLKYECSLLGVHDYPPDDFLCKVYLQRGKNLNLVSLEQALCTRLEQQFYRVGPEMALYMLCDWQLWLWMEGKTGIFHNFKSDSFHQAFAKKYGAGIVPLGKHDFAAWWCQHKECEKIPPRLANECIWLGMAYKDV